MFLWTGPVINVNIHRCLHCSAAVALVEFVCCVCSFQRFTPSKKIGESTPNDTFSSICSRVETGSKDSSRVVSQHIPECFSRLQTTNVTATKPSDDDQRIVQATRTEYVHFAPNMMSPLETEVTTAGYVEPLISVSEAGSTSLTPSSPSIHEYSYCSAETTLVSSSVTARLPPEVSRTTTTLIATATSSGVSTAAVVTSFTSQSALPVRATAAADRRPRLVQLWRWHRENVDPPNSFECEELRRVRVTSSGSSTKVGIVSVRPLCVYCSEPFDPTSNRPGRCPDAPDRSARLVDRAACMCCARAVVYHCLRPDEDECHDPTSSRSIGGRHRCVGGDPDTFGGAPSPHDIAFSPVVVDLPSAVVVGDVDADPCACNGSLTPLTRCKRWSVLAALSLVVPCLWCYWPMVACHRCAVETGCCGGRHRPAVEVDRTCLGVLTVD